MQSFDLSSLHIPAGQLLRVLPKLLAALTDGKLTTEEILGIVSDLAITVAENAVAAPPAPPARPPTPPPVAIPPVLDDESEDSIPVTASIELSRIRAVLSGKRFPGQPPNVEPNPAPGDAFNYGTAVTYEATLHDAAGKIIDTGKFGGVGHKHTAVFYCLAPDGSTGRIGPGSGVGLVLVGARTIGAGGKNYEENNGTTATFRFGFADVPVEGEFQVWCEEGGVRSPVSTSRVS